MVNAMEKVAIVPVDLPGAEIVSRGLADLAAGRDTPEASAVAMASARLGAAGIAVPPSESAEPASHRLYDQLVAEDPRNAHSRYNAIVRRMVSFARAAEHASSG